MDGRHSLTSSIKCQRDVALQRYYLQPVENRENALSAHPYGDEHNHGNYREDRRDLWENNTDLIVSYNKENLLNSGFSVNAFWWNSPQHEIQFKLYQHRSADHTQCLYVCKHAETDPFLFLRIRPVAAKCVLFGRPYLSKKYFTVSTTGRVDKTSALPSDKNSGIFIPLFL